MNCKRILSLLLPALLLAQLPLFANNPTPWLLQQRQDFEKTFSESFDVNGDGSVHLENRYGEIKVETWDRDEVKVDVRIKVSARDKEAADRIFDRIEINFSGSGNHANVSTIIGDRNRKSKSIITKILDGDYWNPGKSSSNDFRIYYRVQMPRSVDLETEAKYCDVELPDLSGDTELKVGYGDLVTGDLDGRNEISISYGSARIGTLGQESTFRIRYSEGSIRGAQDLRYDGRYSETRIGPTKHLNVDAGYEEIEVESAEELRMDGSYNELSIEQVGRLFIDGNYNDFDIDRVDKELEVDAAYGDLRIDGLTAGFDRVYVRTRYIDVDIDVDSDAGFDMELRTRYGGVSYPSIAKNTHSQKDGNSRYVKGTVPGTGKGNINISTSYGDINID